MSTPETQPAASTPERRPFQFSLRALFGLTCSTAAFFSLARTLGYADAMVILAAIVVTVGIMEYPRRVRPVTAILLTLVAGTLLWANLRPAGREREWGLPLAAKLDPVAEGMFYRGWPLSPSLVCLVHGMKFHPTEFGVLGILVLDGVVFAVVLFVVRSVYELCFRRRGKPIVETPPTTSHPQTPPPAGSTSGPRLE